MPKGALIILIIGAVVFFVGVVLSVIIFKNIRKYYVCDYNGHSIEVKHSFTYCQLFVDGKLVDELKSYRMNNASLNAKVDDVDIKVRIGSGFLKPIVKVFINNQLVEIEEKKENKGWS